MRHMTLFRAIANARPKIRRSRPQPDLAHALFFRSWQPSYWTANGLVRCRLHRIAISPFTGKTVAYYDLPGARDRYLYAFVKGKPTEIKRYQRR